MLTICKNIRILVKIFSVSSSKDITTFFIKSAYIYKKACTVVYIASYTIQLVTSGNPVNSYLTFTADKSYHGPIIFLYNFCSFFSYTGGVLITNRFVLLLMEGGFMITFLICRDLLNCVRRVGTIVITTESG